MEGERDSKVVGRVGDHLDTKIKYLIGWSKTEEGTVVLSESAIKNPEFELFGAGLPEGVTFNDGCPGRPASLASGA